jgi:hypothetical protein
VDQTFVENTYKYATTSTHIHLYIYTHTYACIEQKTKQVNIYSLFVREYITRISQVQKLQNSKLLENYIFYVRLF